MHVLQGVSGCHIHPNNLCSDLATYPSSTGLGFSLSFTPATAMVGSYFSERKALAYGIAMSGTDIFTYLLLCFLVIYTLLSHLLSSTSFFSLFFDSSVIFSSLFLSSSTRASPLLLYSPCLISSHQIQFHLTFRERHWDLHPGSCGPAAHRALLLERSSAHPGRICFQPVCLWCSDETAGTKKVNPQLCYYCLVYQFEILSTYSSTYTNCIFA